MPGTLMKKENALWRSAVRFFEANPAAWRVMRSIVSRQPGGAAVPAEPSLRLISYFVSAYARDFPTPMPVLSPREAPAPAVRHAPAGTGGGVGSPPQPIFGPGDIFSCYRQMLRIHTKHRFDPFCRRDRSALVLHGTRLQTNVGQLVFFRWFVGSGVYDVLVRKNGEVTAHRLREMQARRKAKKRAVAQRSAPGSSGGSCHESAPPKGFREDTARFVMHMSAGKGQDGPIRIAVCFD